MKRTLTILFVLAFFTVNVRAALQFTPVTNTMIITVSDSFDVGTFANGHTCWDEVLIAMEHPEVMWRFRYASRSGENNHGLLTNNLPAVAMPLAGSMHGTNDVWFWIFASGNGGQNGNSNFYFTNIVAELQFPMSSYTIRAGQVTNDWPWSTNGLHWTVFGDSVYLGSATGNEPVRLYSLDSSNAAFVFAVPFIDSFSHTSFSTNLFVSDPVDATNLYFPFDPAFTHPQRRAHQFSRHVGDSIQLGLETNVWSWTQDFQSSTISNTNHCVVSGVTRTANSFTATIKLDRNGGPVETANASHTNDVRDAFIQNPPMTNAFNEVLTFTNLAAGTYITSLDGTPVSTNAAVLGTVAINFYHIYQGAWYAQEMLVLDGVRQIRDVNTTNAASSFGQTYMLAFNSETSIGWPTNQGVAAYTSVMQPFENVMEAKDAEIFTNVQQTTHTLTFTGPQATTTTTVSIGTLHIY